MFNSEYICDECARNESELQNQIQSVGLGNLDHCGFVPTHEFIFSNLLKAYLPFMLIAALKQLMPPENYDLIAHTLHNNRKAGLGWLCNHAENPEVIISALREESILVEDYQGLERALCPSLIIHETAALTKSADFSKTGQVLAMLQHGSKPYCLVANNMLSRNECYDYLSPEKSAQGYLLVEYVSCGSDHQLPFSYFAVARPMDGANLNKFIDNRLPFVYLPTSKKI